MRARSTPPWFAVLALLIGVSAGAGCSLFASKGTMPPPGPNGMVDASLAPDFIAVAGRDGGIAGYVPRQYVLPGPDMTTGLPAEADIPVYGDDLRTLVGHMVVGKGFVPLGVDPATVPDIGVKVAPSLAAPSGRSTSLTLYVRSAVEQATWFAIRAGGGLVGGTGYNNGFGVGCDNVPVGGQVVLLDRPPQDPGVQTLRTIYTRGPTTDRATLWVDIAADGAVSQGEGVPGWWQGPPQAC